MAELSKAQNRHILLGAYGEQLVVDYVTQRGSQVLDRNWRIREGEIDIVAQRTDGVITFIEVKTRSSLNFGHPLESISKEKARRLQRLALAWLAVHESFGMEYSIDCAAVLVLSDGTTSIDYRPNVL